VALGADALHRRGPDREGDLSNDRFGDVSSQTGVSELGTEDDDLLHLLGEVAENGTAKEPLSVTTPLANQMQIARQRATSIAKAFNGSWSAIRKAGKLDDMLKEYQEVVEAHDARQEVERKEGNAEVAKYSLTVNAKLKERKDRLYTEDMNRGRADLNKSKEEALSAIYNEKQQHALACQKLMANNPYPVNSSQFDAVKTSCAGEDSRNLDNATLWRPGSHDGGTGPNGGVAGSAIGQRGEGPYEEKPPAGANGTSWFSQKETDETELMEDDEDLADSRTDP